MGGLLPLAFSQPRGRHCPGHIRDATMDVQGEERKVQGLCQEFHLTAKDRGRQQLLGVEIL